MKSINQVSNEAIENEVYEIVSKNWEQKLDFNQFAEEVVTLDKTFLTLFDDPSKRIQYQNASNEQKLAYYDPELVETLRKVYEGFYLHAQTTQELAQNVYKLGLLMNINSYGELSKTLSEAFKRKLSRSYVYKLYMAGKALSDAPVLKIVSDVEKLAQIGKLPTSVLNAAISTGVDIVTIGNMDIVKSSRAQLSDELREQFPQYCVPKRSQKNVMESPQLCAPSDAICEPTNVSDADGPLVKLMNAIDVALAQELDEELRMSLTTTLVLVKARCATS